MIPLSNPVRPRSEFGIGSAVKSIYFFVDTTGSYTSQMHDRGSSAFEFGGIHFHREREIRWKFITSWGSAAAACAWHCPGSAACGSAALLRQSCQWRSRSRQPPERAPVARRHCAGRSVRRDLVQKRKTQNNARRNAGACTQSRSARRASVWWSN